MLGGRICDVPLRRAELVGLAGEKPDVKQPAPLWLFNRGRMASDSADQAGAKPWKKQDRPRPLISAGVPARQAAGLALFDLHAEAAGALFRDAIVRFSADGRNARLPQHTLSPGDIVLISRRQRGAAHAPPLHQTRMAPAGACRQQIRPRTDRRRAWRTAVRVCWACAAAQ